MDKPGLHCRHCGTHLAIKGVCTIYCPNNTCQLPALNVPGASIVNPPKDIQAQGLVALDKPLFEVRHGPLGSDGVPDRFWIESLTDAGPENLTAGTKLFLQPFTPTLQGTTDAGDGEAFDAWAVLVLSLKGKPQFFLDATEVQARARLELWKDGETASKEIRKVRVHGLTAKAFEEAQHYRAASRAYAQNAIDLRARYQSQLATENALREKLDQVTKAVLALSLVSGRDHPDQWKAVHEALALSTDPSLT